MAWWVARFECGDELEVSTTTQDKTAAWEKVRGMFPKKDRVGLMGEGEGGPLQELTLGRWGYRS